MKFLTLLLLLTTVAVTHGFLPTWYAKLMLISPVSFFTTRTHHQITEDAHMAVVVAELARRSDVFTKPKKNYINTDVFRNVVQQFTDGAEEIDQLSRPYSAEEHVDSEQIFASHNRLKTLSRQIRDDILSNRMDDARRKTGNALHTLQDFYSHSNWIELGNSAISSQFGQDDSALVDNAAGSGDKTCTNCGNTVTECVGNSDPADTHNLLTTGYYASIKDKLLGGVSPKPAEKCSHGGLFDATGLSETPLGGINKDTTGSFLSPHSRYHTQAAALAQTASIRYIKNIRDKADPSSPISDDLFDEFLGLSANYTLCFVIDTTGSMADEIDAVRITTINVVNAATTSDHQPGDYVLVPFNDPDFGPAMETKNPDVMISWLSNLTADGGGDFPEMSMSGMLLALAAVRPSSTCYVYTDAPAKDQSLYPVVKTQALLNNVKLVFLLTDLGLKRRKRRSASREKRSSYDYYDDLATSSGGSMIEVSKSAILDATAAVVATGSRPQQVTLFVADQVSSQFQFYVDTDVDSIVLQLSGYADLAAIRTPTGDAFTNYTILLSTPQAKQFSFGQLEPGLWSVTLTDLANSVLVTGSSLVNFDYKFTVDSDGSHGGFLEISGMPVAGTSYYIMTSFYGGVDRSTGASTNAVANVTSLTFVSTIGTVLDTQPLIELVSLQTYVTNATTISNAAFRVVLNGLDSAGNVIQRYDQAILTPAVTSVSLEIIQNGTLRMSPGSSVTVCINVTNFGSSDTWYIRVSDTGSYYTGFTPLTVYLSTGDSQSMCLRFTAPLAASFGDVSTVTVTVGGSSDTSVDNYLVFYLTADDVTPPVVTVTETAPVKQCSQFSNCADGGWAVSVSVNDAGSGLQSVSVQPVNTSSGGAISSIVGTFTLNPFTVGTNSVVNGKYTATCCNTTAVVRAVDVSGNVNAVVIGTPIQGSPSKAATGPVSCLLLTMVVLVASWLYQY